MPEIAERVERVKALVKSLSASYSIAKENGEIVNQADVESAFNLIGSELDELSRLVKQ